MPPLEVEGKSKIGCNDVKAAGGCRSPKRWRVHAGNPAKDDTSLAGEAGGKIYSVAAWPLN
jgi:hypothetical protein